MEKLKVIFARVMGVSEKDINEDSSVDNIDSWDSFNSLMLISEIEKNFSLTFKTDEIISIKKFSDIVNILKKRGIHNP